MISRSIILAEKVGSVFKVVQCNRVLGNSIIFYLWMQTYEIKLFLNGRERIHTNFHSHFLWKGRQIDASVEL